MEELEVIEYKPKNVCEELKSFLESNPHDWFTNEQLSEHIHQSEILTSTASSIRNAFSKLKNTNLIKTRMDGSLAYRGWHTANSDDFLPNSNNHELSSHKKFLGRSCNGCGTCHSRYWRSDLVEKDAWLCNNCGQNY